MLKNLNCDDGRIRTCGYNLIGQSLINLLYHSAYIINHWQFLAGL